MKPLIKIRQSVPIDIYLFPNPIDGLGSTTLASLKETCCCFKRKFKKILFQSIDHLESEKKFHGQFEG